MTYINEDIEPDNIENLKGDYEGDLDEEDWTYRQPIGTITKILDPIPDENGYILVEINTYLGEK